MANRNVPPHRHERFRVFFKCGACEHEWESIYEWPQQDQVPAEDCPECGEDGTNRVYYEGAERAD
jgi:DNA-directed RNA polymerase subunit M/transcription elongation factor TFIIS